MKKQIIFLIMFIGVLAVPAKAAESKFSVSEALQSYMLINNPEKAEKIKELNETLKQKVIERDVDYYTHLGREEKIEWMIQATHEYETLIPESAFCFYTLKTQRYAEQYAKEACFDLLVNDEKIWMATVKGISESKFYYDKDFQESKAIVKIKDDEIIKFLKKPDEIEKMVSDAIDEEIVDCKIIEGVFGVLLYLKGSTTDYGMVLCYREMLPEYLENLEKYQIYKMSEIMNRFGKIYSLIYDEVGPNSYWYYDRILDQKPTYDTESAALMEAGLIAGTDKGMEPLKPLSRIEATAILVRILGLENSRTSENSYFTDIANDNWGRRYANIAYDNGIAAGVGDGKFAPEQTITASQFVTLLLRSRNQPNVDWQTAINIFVERGIITQEQADKMDLFTRGDMAKIIYEAREKGLI